LGNRVRVSHRFVVGLTSVALIMSAAAKLHAADTALVDAIRTGDAAAVHDLVKDRTKVNAAAADGTTPLHWAAYLDNLALASELVRAGANANATDRYGTTPLMLASTNGNAALIEALLKAGADANAAAADGETPLMTVARTGNAAAVQVLLKYHADANHKEKSRDQTALMWAASDGHTAAVQALVAGGANIKDREHAGFTAFLFAVRAGRAETVRALLDLGADVNETVTLPPAGGRSMFVNGGGRRGGGGSGPPALTLAVANGHFELASMLLDKGANPNLAPQGWTALHEITWVRKPGFGGNQPAPEGSGSMDSLEIVKRLVAKGANVNARMTKKADMQSTNINCVDATPFFLASWARDVELMRLLVKLGADPLLPNADYTTPLLVAAGVGTYSPGDDPGTDNDVVEAVKLTLELGNNVNAIDDNDETAMHGAAYRQVPAVVRLLAEHGARPDVWNQKNEYGWTPLMIAQGVRRQNNIHSSPETAAAIRQLLGLK